MASGLRLDCAVYRGAGVAVVKESGRRTYASRSGRPGVTLVGWEERRGGGGLSSVSRLPYSSPPHLRGMAMNFGIDTMSHHPHNQTASEERTNETHAGNAPDFGGLQHEAGQHHAAFRRWRRRARLRGGSRGALQKIIGRNGAVRYLFESSGQFPRRSICTAPNTADRYPVDGDRPRELFVSQSLPGHPFAEFHSAAVCTWCTCKSSTLCRERHGHSMR